VISEYLLCNVLVYAKFHVSISYFFAERLTMIVLLTSFFRRGNIILQIIK
jgi:hypothetical protein